MDRDPGSKPARRTFTDWLKVSALLLDEAAVLLLVLLVIWASGIKVPLPITVFTAILLGALVFVIHKAIIPSLRRKAVSGREGMIGSEGRATTPLAPAGWVTVKGERWNAKSVGGDIEGGEDVEVTGLDGLTLLVKRKER